MCQPPAAMSRRVRRPDPASWRCGRRGRARVARAVRRPPTPRNLSPVSTPSWRSARVWNSSRCICGLAEPLLDAAAPVAVLAHDRRAVGVRAALVDQQQDLVERLLLAGHAHLEGAQPLVDEARDVVLRHADLLDVDLEPRHAAVDVRRRRVRAVGVVAIGHDAHEKDAASERTRRKGGWGPGRGGRPLGRRRVRRGRRRGVRWSLSTRQPLCRGRAPHQGRGLLPYSTAFDTCNR
jgi:hypothetical protein